MDLIRKRKDEDDLYIITNGGDDGEGFLKQAREEGIKTEACIFTSWMGCKDWSSKQDSQYGCTTTVTTSSHDVEQFVERNLELKL